MPPPESHQVVQATPPFVVTNAALAPRAGARPPVLMTCVTTPAGDSFWRACDDALRSYGSALAAITLHDVHSPCPMFGIAGSAIDASSLGRKWPRHAPLDASPLDEECVSRALNWERRGWARGQDLTDLAVRGLRAASWLARAAVDTIRPGLILSWYGPTAVLAGFESAFRSMDLPRLFVERGAMPSTFVLDSIGVLAPSEPTRDPGWSRMMRAPASPEEVRRGRLIASVISGDRRENWSQNPAVRSGRIRLDASAIAYFPSNDMGHEFDPPSEQRSCGMPFGDSESSLAALLAALATVAPQTRVVIKRHPHDPLARRFERFVSERVTIDDTMSVHDAIDAGMVIATTSGSIGWISIAGGANAVSLTTRSYTGSGALFEPATQRELESAIRDALRGAIAPDDPRRFSALARCASRYAYSDDPNYLAGGMQSPSDLAVRLLRSAIGDAGQCDADAWLDTLSRTGVATCHDPWCDETPGYLQRTISHARIALEIVARLDPSRPVVVLGYGQNGRALCDAAHDAGLSFVVFDDSFAETGVAVANHPGIRAEARMESLDPSAQWVVTPVEDGAMVARIPAGVTPVRWRETLESLTRSGSRSAARVRATPRPQTTQPVHREVQHEST